MAKDPIMVAKIEALKSPNGGWTRHALASLGVSWPPKAGWKARLETVHPTSLGLRPPPAPTVAHALKMAAIGSCPDCAGRARVNGEWCVACGATGRRDEYDLRQSRVEGNTP